MCCQDPGDLTVAEGQVVTLLWKDEEEWWTVRDARGSYGLVPAKYLDKVMKLTIPLCFIVSSSLVMRTNGNLQKIFT